MTNAKLYVGNLNYQATEEQVKDLFANYGDVNEVNIIDGKGFGFVQMANAEDAEKAKNELNSTEFMGRTIRVDNAKPKRNNRNNNFRRNNFNREGSY